MKKSVVAVLLLLLLTGCEMLPFARELESTMLVQVLGVDWTREGVTLTGAADSGRGSGEGSTLVLSASGETLDQAKQALKGKGEEYVSLTHVAQLVLGAETDLATVLKAALEEPALGQSATVWLAEEGSARTLMESVGGGARRLSSIELNSGVQPVTVLQSMMRLEEDGWVEIPLIKKDADTLTPAGTRVIGEGENEE